MVKCQIARHKTSISRQKHNFCESVDIGVASTCVFKECNSTPVLWWASFWDLFIVYILQLCDF